LVLDYKSKKFEVENLVELDFDMIVPLMMDVVLDYALEMDMT
jgi:hypothetical protein